MISAGERPWRSVMNESRSIISRPSRWASARATVVLPQPMKPTMTMRRSLIARIWLALLNQGIEQAEKFRKRDGDAISILDFRFSFSYQSGDAERHGDPVIAMRIDLRSAQSSRTRNPQAVIEFLDFCAHRSQAACGGRNPIRFLDAQLCRVAHLEAA